jgi:hypothetical protein
VLALGLAFAATWASRVRADAHYTVPGDGTVKDNWTGLIWQRTVDLQACPNDGGPCTWQHAVDYCNGLGLPGGDWRLPSVKELSSLVDDQSKRSPPMDPSAFPDSQPADLFWSSSVFAGDPSLAWSVYFDDGSVDALAKDSTYRVRCVR